MLLRRCIKVNTVPDMKALSNTVSVDKILSIVKPEGDKFIFKDLRC